MIKIDIHQKYYSGDFTYENFCNLTEEQLLMILDWRNHDSIRKLMTNTLPISKETHLKYVEGLKKRNDSFYWLVSKKENPIGVMSISNINYQKLSCEPGYYLCPMLLDSGFGLDFHYSYKNFILNILGFNRVDGYIQQGNNGALILALFFNSLPNGIINKDNRFFLTLSLTKADFNKVLFSNIQFEFAKFIRSHRSINWDALIQQYQ